MTRRIFFFFHRLPLPPQATRWTWKNRGQSTRPQQKRTLQGVQIRAAFQLAHPSPPSPFRYAASVGAKHYQTSAKQNKGIEEMFLDLTRRKWILLVVRGLPLASHVCRLASPRLPKGMLSGSGSNASRRTERKSIVVTDAPEPQKQAGGGCC